MRLLIVGAGGHAKVVLDAALSCGFEIAAVLGDAGGATELLGIPVIQRPADLASITADAFIIGIGDNRARAEAYAEYVALGLTPATVVHPSATIAESAVLGPGTFVAAGAVVNPSAVIGANTILNTGCTVDHDCVIGEHTLIGPTASLCGGVRIGDGTLIGAGSSVVPGVAVGTWCTVGAGAAVLADVADSSVAVGVPAVVVKRIEA